MTTPDVQIAWRAWALGFDPATNDPLLASPFAGGIKHYAATTVCTNHPPEQHCPCGVYAYPSEADAIAHLSADSGPTSRRRRVRVLGAVLLGGAVRAVAPGELTATSLTLTGPQRLTWPQANLAPVLAARYGVPFFPDRLWDPDRGQIPDEWRRRPSS